ncbi:MAG: CapA family protein, partial [Ruaniaceae bacterium]|nr:CapA family protein [Ruaniaceae bacterium]
VTAGDVLPHATVNRNAQQADGSYNYVPMMENLRGYIEGADIALCSLEVPLAPEGEAVTAYPVFGAPPELITSLKEIGWDGCATATNHSLDRGRAGVARTIDVMDEVGLGRAGTGRSAEEAASAQFYEVERDGASFTLAHLSATTFHNDYTNPADFADAVAPLVSAQTIIDAASRARDAGADVVVFTPHWGQEYWKETDALQREISQALADSGMVDVVMGGHAHVPQPSLKLDGGADGRGMWVAYSMGNFLSNQDENCCDITTSTGQMPRVTIVVDGDDVYVDGFTWHGNMGDTQGGQVLYPIHDLLDGQRPDGLTLTADRISARWNAMAAILGTDQLDTSLPATGGATVTVVPRSE